MSKVMVITGSRKGIGRYLAEYYLERGFIVFGCSRSETDLSAKNYRHFYLDVCDEKAVVKTAAEIYKENRRIDYLVNNAAIASMNHTMLTPLSVVEEIFRTNLFGTFLFCREIGKYMVKNRFGRIVNFTSIAVPLHLAGEAAYASSKAAVEEFTKILAKEFAYNGVTCNAIGPCPIKTDLMKNVPEEKVEELLNQQSIKKWGTLEDISNVTDFFVSDKSTAITGQVIYLNGVS